VYALDYALESETRILPTLGEEPEGTDMAINGRPVGKAELRGDLVGAMPVKKG
jgi:hypothetical protein